MDNLKDDLYYATKRLEDVDFMIQHTQAISRKQFEKTAIPAISLLLIEI